MDETLFIETVLFYKNLCKNIGPKFKFDSNKFIKGPILIKTDSCPGKHCKSKRAIKFCCSKMHLEGVHLLPGLPSETSCSQRWKTGSKTLRGKNDAYAGESFEQKAYDHAMALKNWPEDGETEVKNGALRNDNIPMLVNGLKSDPIHLQLFDSCTLKEKIFKSSLAVGFVPFTCNAIHHNKFWHMLGEGGTS